MNINKNDLLLEVPYDSVSEMPDKQNNDLWTKALFKKRELWIKYPKKKFIPQEFYYDQDKNCYCLLFEEEQ